MNIQVYNSIDTFSPIQKKQLIDFFFKHLDEFGDEWKYIESAVDYALNPNPGFGGFILYIKEDIEILGAVVMNNTGMKGYIPENILVYIAVHNDSRGKGLGQMLMQKAIQMAKGNIALHVESDNPARILYEKIGFKNPYLEMRYYKE